MGITHPKVLAQADNVDADDASPSDWNAAHTITSFALTADISPTAISATTNDWAPTGLSTAAVVRISTNDTTERVLTGLAGGAGGRIIELLNVGTGNIVITSEAGTSSAANRFLLAAAVRLRPEDGIQLIYDAASSRWRTTGRVPTGTTPAPVFSTTNVAGTSAQHLRADDQLAIFDATAPAAVGTAGAGAAAVAARRDHVHPTGAGTPSTQAFGDSAAVGSGPAAAMSDHKHAMPAAPSDLATHPLADAKGDLFVASAADTIVRVPVGTDGQQLCADSATASGVSWRGGLLASLVAPSAAIANVETVILAATIPANYLKAGDTVVIRVQGVGTTSTTPGTGTWRLRFDPTTLNGASVTSLAPAFVASRTAKGYTVEFTLNVYTIGATGTLIGEGFAQASASTNDLFTTTVLNTVTTAAKTVDTTVQNLLEVSFQSGASTANATAHTGYIRQL